MIRCKVRCIGVEKTESWNKEIPFVYKSRFTAVGDGSPENKAFWQATPTGMIEFSTVKEDHFKVGQSYYVDFTEAPSA